MNQKIEEMLTGREERYGSFENHAKIAQSLKRILQAEQKWEYLSADKKEALEMICHKIARVINGDQNYQDNWVDIAGYATLISQGLSHE